MYKRPFKQQERKSAMLKVVLDTNLFISGLINPLGPPAQLLNAWRRYAYILITSREILEEIERVLTYSHIVKKYHLSREVIESNISLIKQEAIVLFDTIKLNVIKSDPDDNKVLACALEAKAQYIISGDDHLLNLGQYQDIKIITAREFLKILQ